MSNVNYNSSQNYRQLTILVDNLFFNEYANNIRLRNIHKKHNKYFYFKFNAEFEIIELFNLIKTNSVLWFENTSYVKITFFVSKTFPLDFHNKCKLLKLTKNSYNKWCYNVMDEGILHEFVLIGL